MSLNNTSTIRLLIPLGYIIVGLFIITFLLSGCKGRSKSHIRTENIDSALTQAYSLYKLIGYDELDTVSKTFNRLSQLIEYYDSLQLKPPDYEKIIQVYEQLSAYFTSFNEFHEEIYAIEDNLLFLENAYKSGEIGADNLRKRIAEENTLLEDIQRRILLMHHKADSAVSALSTAGVKLSYPVGL